VLVAIGRADAQVDSRPCGIFNYLAARGLGGEALHCGSVVSRSAVPLRSPARSTCGRLGRRELLGMGEQQEQQVADERRWFPIRREAAAAGTSKRLHRSAFRRLSRGDQVADDVLCRLGSAPLYLLQEIVFQRAEASERALVLDRCSCINLHRRWRKFGGHRPADQELRDDAGRNSKVKSRTRSAWPYR